MVRETDRPLPKKPLVREPETGDWVPALEVQPNGTSQGTYLIGEGATQRSVFVPGENPGYTLTHSELVSASSAEQYEKHGFGD